MDADLLAHGLHSYDKDQPDGLVLRTATASGKSIDVEIEHTDAAFILCALVARYGIGFVVKAIGHIASEDPAGERVGLSVPARILQGPTR